MASEVNEKELTLDILFGLNGELSDIGLKPAQGALLDAFQQAVCCACAKASNLNRR